jgi:hypothetical protein
MRITKNVAAGTVSIYHALVKNALVQTLDFHAQRQLAAKELKKND